MCKFCFNSFRAAHKSTRDGKLKPFDAKPVEHIAKPESDHWADGSLSNSIDFDFDQVDRNLGWVKDTPRDVRKEAAEMFKKLLSNIWPDGSHARPAFVRFLAASCVLDPSLLEGKSMEEIGAQLNASKQSISRFALKFSDSFNLKFRRQRSKSGRKNMSAGQKGHPNFYLGAKNAKAKG